MYVLLLLDEAAKDVSYIQLIDGGVNISYILTDFLPIRSDHL